MGAGRRGQSCRRSVVRAAVDDGTRADHGAGRRRDVLPGLPPAEQEGAGAGEDAERAQAQRRGCDDRRNHRAHPGRRRQGDHARSRAQRQAARRAIANRGYFELQGVQQEGRKRGCILVDQTQSFGPILILLVLIVSFLYMHFTNGSGLTRIYIAGAIVVAAILILLPSAGIQMPDWAGFGSTKIQLGLDLQGGTHLLMAVKLDEAVKTQLRRRADDLKKELKEKKIDGDVAVDDSGNLTVKLKSSSDRTAFLDLADKSFTDLTVSSNTDSSSIGPVYSMAYKPQELQTIRSNAMDQALETIRNRIDQLGVRETTVAKDGDNEILVQLPGIQDPERAKELIGKTAVLEFKLVDDTKNVQDAIKDGPPPGDEILYGTSETGGREPYLVESPVLMTGDTVTDARVRPGARLEGPYVAVELDNRGADIFDAMTSENGGGKTP